MGLYLRGLARYQRSEVRTLLGSYLVHVFVFQEEDVGVHTVLPKLLNMLKPGTIAH